MPIINKPNQHFDATLYTGNGSATQNINTGISPDFVWIKSRTSGTGHHSLVDRVRGDIALNSNQTIAEYSVGDFNMNTNGTIDVPFYANDYSMNTSGNSYVAWNWKESALAGFDIVTYTGNGGTGASSQYVNHNLGVTPNLIITKVRSSGATYPGWYVYLSAVQSGNFAYYGRLDSTSPWSNGSSPYQLWTANSTQIAFNETSNESGKNYVAYCFAEVAGYSKFGSYTGTGAGETNGPFIYCGFRPALIIIKVDTNGYNWAMMDNERPGYNSISYRIMADAANEETTAGDPQLDFLSNGFKLRAGNANYAGTVYYMAFAEAPLKFANAR